MTDTPIVDTEVLREQVREKYRAVAVDPGATYHFHTGRPPRPARLRPGDRRHLAGPAVESFAGVATLLAAHDPARRTGRRRRVRGGFDSFVAAHHVGPEGVVVGST